MTTERPTIIVGVDAVHAAEWSVSLPTWLKNVPGIREFPFLVIADDPVTLEIAHGMVRHHELTAHVTSAYSILPKKFPRRFDVTQREMMLSALAFAPLEIETRCFFKIDTDTVAFPLVDCLLSTMPKVSSKRPFAAPRWGYTKPGHWVDTLDRWSDEVAPGNAKPYRVTSGGVARSNRFISYAMIGDTTFARECLSLAGSRLPVPSQDTFYWYCAELLGRKVIRLNPHDTCWRHAGGNHGKLARLAAEALE